MEDLIKVNMAVGIAAIAVIATSIVLVIVAVIKRR